ncbi:MAG: hypothetical protein CMK52_02540 [Proteobacteria bacterium]|nr:hypothetical protein [Pseudomonadota bacterium]
MRIMRIKLETRRNRKRQKTVLFLLITKKSPSTIPIIRNRHKSVYNRPLDDTMAMNLTQSSKEHFDETLCRK